MIYTIWYMKPEHFPSGIMGGLPAPDLSTHVSLGPMAAEFKNDRAVLRDLNFIYQAYQAMCGSPVWPDDEAGIQGTNRWLESLGLSHTSMSVGDVIESEDGSFWLVASHGFKELKPPEWEYIK